jgi:hypothetical protein
MKPPLPASVLLSLQNAVRPHRDRPLFRNFCLLILLFLAFPAFPPSSAATESASLDDAVRQLAERVAAIPNLRGPVRLQFFQDANFASNTGKGWQEIFRKEMEQRRFTLAEDPGATLLRVGLSETPTQLVLAASARVADKDEVWLISLPRITFRAANLPVAPIRIERQLVYQNSDRILDASSLWNGSEGGMALLAYRNVELSALRLDATGQVTQTVSLTAAGAHLSRDPHGELMVRANDAVVLLPGKSCEFSWTSPADTKCRSAKPAWRGPTVLTPSCDAGGWKLLADGSDWTSPDVLQVVPDGSSHEGSAALLSDFPGPILGINGEQNPASALVVTRNLRTGNYEVYKITLACGN